MYWALTISSAVPGNLPLSESEARNETIWFSRPGSVVWLCNNVPHSNIKKRKIADTRMSGKLSGKNTGLIAYCAS
jgi:hypothetical protein